jgi:hypothetical protein
MAETKVGSLAVPMVNMKVEMKAFQSVELMADLSESLLVVLLVH